MQSTSPYGKYLPSTWTIWVLINILMPLGTGQQLCSRYPANIHSSRAQADENFIIMISGNPQTYILGQTYNVSLYALNGRRFISAKLALELDSQKPSSATMDLGHFELIDTVETHFSPQCVNMVESTNATPKQRLDVTWIAPIEPNTGCVLIRATIVQHRDIWFMDDGGLTKRICAEDSDGMTLFTTGSTNARDCCACDEVRYEIVFESMWSRNLHPKEFPSKIWTTGFSDIVGVTHIPDYRFWDAGLLASQAMQEFAEHGATNSLEQQFKRDFKQSKVRTMVKAKGPSFPHLNGKSLAAIRMDPRHNQLSIVAKIQPSPDWFVGIAGLDMCLPNCTWMEGKLINLYPWDAGTDAGTTYTAPDQTQMPPDVIRRIRSNIPSLLPFYDESGAAMKPFATLRIRRQKIYERKCEDNDSNNDNELPRECLTHPWTQWSECSVSCGEGRQQRIRIYKQPELAKIYNCDDLIERRQDRPCNGGNCFHSLTLKSLSESKLKRQELNNINNLRYRSDYYNKPDLVDFDSNSEYIENQNINCQLTEWSPWTECNSTCGEGVQMHKRSYRNPTLTKDCQQIYYVKLLEYRKCYKNQCFGDLSSSSDNEIITDDDDHQSDDNDYDDYATNWQKNERRDYNELEKFVQYDKNIDLNLDNLVKSHNSQSIHKQQPKIDDNNRVWKAALTNNPRSRKKILLGNDYDTSYDKDIEHSKDPSYALVEDSNYSENSDRDKFIPEICFQSLQIDDCSDTRIIGNFWFYNSCRNECMLYAADICDRNVNRFTSLEQCIAVCQEPLAQVTDAFLQKHLSPKCLKIRQRQLQHIPQRFFLL